MHYRRFLYLMPLLLGLWPAQAHANIVITPTFSSSITSDPNAAAIEGSINSVISGYESTFSNPINVTIAFYADPTVGLGQSVFAPLDYSYTDYRNALLGESSIASTISQDLPTTNPVPGNANDGVEATTAQLRAIGLAGAPQLNIGGTEYDSEIDLNTSIMNLSRTGPQDPNKFDIQGVVTHEIDEVLGLSSALDGQSNAPVSDPVPPAQLFPSGAVDSLDFYRWSAPGVRSFTNAPNAVDYFSLDRGATPRVYFNQNMDGDFHDWASNGEAFDEGPQAQNAFITPGVDINLGSAEITALQSIGYNLADASPAPEPSQVGMLALMGLGLGGLILRARKRRNAGA